MIKLHDVCLCTGVFVVVPGKTRTEFCRMSTMVYSIFRQNPLLFRLVAYVVGFSVFIIFALPGLQLWFAYHGELSRLQEQLTQLRLCHVPLLVKNVWNVDDDAVEIQLRSILQLPYIEAVSVEKNEGKSILVGTVPQDTSQSIVERIALVKEMSGGPVTLGSLSIYAVPNEVKRRLAEEIPFTLVVESIALILSGIFILTLFFKKYLKHINHIAEYTENLRLDTLGTKLVLDREKPKHDPPDELDRIVTTFNEIQMRVREKVVAQRQTEKRLYREIAFSDAIINFLPGLFVVFNEKLETVLCNKLYSEWLGVAAEQATKLSFIERVVPEDQQRLWQSLKEVFISQEPITTEIALLAEDGERVPYLFNGIYSNLEKNGYVIGLGTDLTEQKKMEDMLTQSQKMEAIGTLAGGIAHDFNNILSSIMGNLQLAQLASSEPEKLESYLQSGIDASIRAKHLIGQILTMGRRGQLEKQTLQISKVLKETMSLLRATIPTTIEIHQEILSEGYIWANATQIQQVLMNLCTNAYHAMQEGGGKLSITLKETEITEARRLPAFELPIGHYILLEVMDNGCGMDPKTKRMIFEPYFTTKDKSSGTGLGLSVVHGIVQSHDGHINVYSELGKGTIFRLYFPLLNEPSLGNEVDIDDPGLLGGTEKILFVDDEKEILSICSELIETYGYKVTSFSDSGKALIHFQEDPMYYDLVLTDMTMPNLTGDILGKRIMELRPDIPVVIYTGFSEIMEHGASIEAGFAAYLTKPVETSELLSTIRKALDENRFKKLHVLLVDDDKYNQQVVTLLLQAQGHQVTVAGNGKEALIHLTKEKFDILFMDMQMPLLDGLQTTAIIRACETGGGLQTEFEKNTGESGDILHGQYIPIVAMTGNLDEESKLQCERVGMDDFLAKPFTIQAVSRVLKGVMQKSIADNRCIPSKECCLAPEKENDLVASAMEYLANLYPLEKEQLELLIRESVLSIKQSLAMLEAGLDKNDYVVVARAAHKMKGTLLGVGAQHCAELCRVLELCAKEKNLQGGTEKSMELKELLASLLVFE